MDLIGEIVEFVRGILRSLLGFVEDLVGALLPQGADPRTANLVVLGFLGLLVAGILLMVFTSRK